MEDEGHVYMQLTGESPKPYLRRLPVINLSVDHQGKYNIEASCANPGDDEGEPISSDGLTETNLAIECAYCGEKAQFALGVGIVRNEEGSVLLQGDPDSPNVYCAPIVLLRRDERGGLDVVTFLSPLSETSRGTDMEDPEPDDYQAEDRIVTEDQTSRESVAEMIARGDTAIQDDPNDPKAHYSRAMAYMLEGDNDSALQGFSRAIELDPQYTEAITKRGVMYGIKGEFRLAMKDFKRALDLDPNYAPAYLNRGICHYHMNNTESALEDLGRVPEMPTEPVLAEQARQYSALCTRTTGLRQCKKGIAHIEHGRLDKAISQLTRVIESNPENAAAYFYLGMACDNNEDYDSSVAALNNAIDLDPEFPCAHNNRGWVYLKTAHYTRAIADFTKEIELDPDLVPAYLNRANAYHNTAQYGLAVADLKTALRLSTDPEQKAKIQRQIQAIRRG